MEYMGSIHTPGMNDHSSIPRYPPICLKCSLELLLCGPPLPEGAKQVNTKGTERTSGTGVGTTLPPVVTDTGGQTGLSSETRCPLHSETSMDREPGEETYVRNKD